LTRAIKDDECYTNTSDVEARSYRVRTLDLIRSNRGEIIKWVIEAEESNSYPEG